MSTSADAIAAAQAFSVEGGRELEVPVALVERSHFIENGDT
jgi:hypothetical protein